MALYLSTSFEIFITFYREIRYVNTIPKVITILTSMQSTYTQEKNSKNNPENSPFLAKNVNDKFDNPLNTKMKADTLRFPLPTVPKCLNNFFAIGAIAQVIILIFMGCFTTWPKTDAGANGAGSVATNLYDVTQYAVLMDIMVMIFVGFAVLFCLIPKYGWSGISIALLIGAMAFEWNMPMRGLIRDAGVPKAEVGAITVTIDYLAESVFASASILIACAGVLGRTSLEQLVILMFFGVPFYNFNGWVCDQIGFSDTGGTIIIHAFGAFFGFGCSWVLGHDSSHSMKRRGSDEGNYHTNIFALLGTILLWIYYPSFNGYAVTGVAKFRACFNTQLALMAAAVTSIVLSDLKEDLKKNMMIHMQTGVLAGGVTLGTLADHPIEPWGAMLLGSVGATVCVLGIRFVTPFLEEKLNVHDTCDCMALHGIPAFISVFASCISFAVADENEPDEVDYAIAYVDGICGKNIACIFVTAALATVFGVFTGGIMGMFSRDDHWYDSSAHFD